MAEIGEAKLQLGDVLTIDETAALLRLRPSTIRKMLFLRRVPFVKYCRRVFIRRADVEALVARSVVPAANSNGR